MSEEFKEQRPLLCEELSEEEQFPEYTRRRLGLLQRNRAKATVKGAAALINRWPEHWSSALNHWWISLGMMALITFVVYNSLVAFTLLPTSAQKYGQPLQKMDKPFLPSSAFPEVYMHVFTESDEEVDLMKYLPYINVAAEKYLDFNFNLILVLNDTVVSENTLSAEENNVNAFNSILSKEKFYKKSYNLRKNVLVTHITLSQYLENSPLTEDWRRIAPQFIPFLVKVVAIWNVGGIAINPDILTPRSPHVIYIDKFYNILNKYKVSKNNTTTNIDEKSKIYSNKHKENKEVKNVKRVNNIRDIIENLKNDDDTNNDTYLMANLTEAENRNDLISFNGRGLLSTFFSKTKNKTRTDILQSMTNQNETFDNENKYNDDVRFQAETNGVEDMTETANINKLHVLPLFLELLFQDKTNIDVIRPEKTETSSNLMRRRKHILYNDKVRKNSNLSALKISNEKEEISTTVKLKPAKNNKHDTSNISISKQIDNKEENIDALTIDLKGNIVATKASCHAFVDSVFRNVIHHRPEETIQDFIIKELSLFCKGLLSSCTGIDVILL